MYVVVSYCKPLVEHGSVSSEEPGSFGDSVFYYCDEGYVYNSSHLLTCSADVNSTTLTWSSSPVCLGLSLNPNHCELLLSHL